MKQFFRFSVMLLALLLPAVAMATDFVVDGICYNINGNEATVTSKGDYYDMFFVGYSGSVVIPATVTYKGTTYPVTSIDEIAFYCCDSLTSIFIPNSITKIGNSAFGNCPVLASIVIESGNPRYDSRNNCNAIIETADNALIAGCKNTMIPNSVTSIGDRAFEGCDGLTSIVIPNSVTAIGNKAFYSCDGLTSIIISNSVTAIGNNVFENCNELASIVIESGNPRYDSRNNCNAIIETADNTLIVGCKNTIIPNSVTSIGDWAFSYCYSLTSINIPNSVTAIGNGAFEGCIGLTSVDISNSVTSIGRYAFFNCEGLTSINIPNSVTAIGSNAFFWCTGLTSIVIPNSVTSIGNEALKNCWSLTDVYCYIADLSGLSCGNELFYKDFNSNYSGRTLHVLQGTADAYRADKNWYPYFGHIVEDLKPDVPGDVNGDLEVNIADVNAVIDIILNGSENPSGDVNCDGEINIADINAVIDIILEN